MVDEALRARKRELERQLEQAYQEKRDAEDARDDADGAARGARRFRENTEQAVSDVERELEQRLAPIKGAKFRRRFREQHRAVLRGADMAALLGSASDGAGDAERQRSQYEDRISACAQRIRQLEDQLYQLGQEISRSEAET